MIGVIRAGRSRSIRSSSSSASTPDSNAPSAAAILRSSSGPITGRTRLDRRRGRVGALRRPRARGTARSRAAAARAGCELVPAGDHDARHGGERRASSVDGDARDQDVGAVARARSRACPSTRSSRKCSTLIAATRTRAHVAAQQVRAAALRRERPPAQRPRSAELGHRCAPRAPRPPRRWVGELRLLGQHVDGRSFLSAASCSTTRRHVRDRHAVDDHAEELAALLVERLARDRATAAVGCVRRFATDHREHRAAELVGEVGVQVEVERGRAVAKSVPSHTTTS